MPTIGVTINLSIECEDDSPLAREIIHNNVRVCVEGNEGAFTIGLSEPSIPDYDIDTFVEKE